MTPEKNIGRQMESFKYLEDISNYDKKLNALAYAALPDEDRMKKFQEVRKLVRTAYTEDDIAPVARYINEEVVHFPMAWYEPAKFPDLQGRKEYTMYYMNTDQMKEYAADLFNEKGEMWPSRDQAKAA